MSDTQDTHRMGAKTSTLSKARADHPISDSDTDTDSEDNDNKLTEVRQPDSRGKSEVTQTKLKKKHIKMKKNKNNPTKQAKLTDFYDSSTTDHSAKVKHTGQTAKKSTETQNTAISRGSLETSRKKYTISRSTWATRDVEDYLQGYPGQSNSTDSNTNLKFYNNQISSKPNGGFIDEIHREWFGNHRLLEQHHGYVQWLFPIRENGMNYQAERLHLHEAQKICDSKKCQLRVLRSYELMLDFYGMKLVKPKTQNDVESERKSVKSSTNTDGMNVDPKQNDSENGSIDDVSLSESKKTSNKDDDVEMNDTGDCDLEKETKEKMSENVTKREHEDVRISKESAGVGREMSSEKESKSKQLCDEVETVKQPWEMKLDEISGEIERAENWRARFAHLNSSMHNYLRITRILKCLGELGFQRFQAPFVKFVLHEMYESGQLKNCFNSCTNYWMPVIKDKTQRDKLISYVESHPPVKSSSWY